MRADYHDMDLVLDENVDQHASLVTFRIENRDRWGLAAWPLTLGRRIRIGLRYFICSGLTADSPTSISATVSAYDPYLQSDDVTDVLASISIEWVQTDAVGTPNTGSTVISPVASSSISAEIDVAGTYEVTVTPTFAPTNVIMPGSLAFVVTDVVIAGAP